MGAHLGVGFGPDIQIVFSLCQRYFHFEQTVPKLTEQAVRLVVSLIIIQYCSSEQAMSKLLCDF